MQLNYLQKILGHIKNGLTCPRCQAIFGSSEIKVLQVNDRNIDVAIVCPHCQTDARISAQVTAHKEKVSAQAHITPETIVGLREQITHLSASDIEGLGAESQI